MVERPPPGDAPGGPHFFTDNRILTPGVKNHGKAEAKEPTHGRSSWTKRGQDSRSATRLPNWTSAQGAQVHCASSQANRLGQAQRVRGRLPVSRTPTEAGRTPRQGTLTMVSPRRPSPVTGVKRAALPRVLSNPVTLAGPPIKPLPSRPAPIKLPIRSRPAPIKLPIRSRPAPKLRAATPRKRLRPS